ncbi:hypothetical protein L6452_40476 [Arctium lappa]|uniref:Uncharacterized protein n=1 Tax=Arctium lappa TaxID=4217 RepID=A0ACB8XN78_ARCLA|nr:hypothetical protein L6452_40476 [Arctium lappa]
MWYLDSGCSKHMTRHKALLSNYTEKFSGNVRFGNDQVLPILGYGDIIQDNITIRKVSYVEGLGHNLFSIGKFSDKGLEVNFKAKRCSVNMQRQVKLLRTDNGTELKNKTVDEYLESVGISHQYSVARTPEQNGIVERQNRTLVGAAHTMLSQSVLHLFLWAEAVSTACHTQNRSMIHRRFQKTPYELINNRTPTIKYFHIFGCKCFVLNDRENLNKFSAKADEGIFIGFSSTSAAYRVYLKKSKTVVESVNVTFDEIMASEQLSSEPVISGILASRQISPEPVSTENNSNNASTSLSHLSDLDFLFEFFYNEFLGSNLPKSDVTDWSEDTSCNHPVTSEVITELVSPVQSETHIPLNTPTVEDIQVTAELEVTVSVGCDTLSTQQPEYVVPTDASAPENFNCKPPPTIQTEEPDSGFQDDNHDQSVSNPLPHEYRWTKEHPLHQIIGDPNKPVQTRSSTLNKCLHDSFLSKIEPTRVSEDLADSDWVSSMQEELNQFEALKVWRLVPKPEGKSVIGTKWVFKNKKDEDGIVIKNKARLVAKGYQQEEDLCIVFSIYFQVLLDYFV